MPSMPQVKGALVYAAAKNGEKFSKQWPRAGGGSSAQEVDGEDRKAQGGEDDAYGPVEGLGAGLVGEQGGDPGPQQGERHAEDQAPQIRRAADGKVADRAGERRKGHDEDAGAHGGLQLIPQHAGQQKEHHHAAPRTHKAADEPHRRAADGGAGRPLLGADPRHGLLGGHHRPDDEADPQQHGHEHREAAHGGVGDGAGDPAAHQREKKNRRHHHKPVFDVQVLVFSVGIGADGAGQHVAGQGDPHRLVGRHTQKGDQHGADDRGGAHPGKPGAQPRPDPGDEADDHLGPHTHSPVPPGVLNPAPVAAPFPRRTLPPSQAALTSVQLRTIIPWRSPSRQRGLPAPRRLRPPTGRIIMGQNDRADGRLTWRS